MYMVTESSQVKKKQVLNLLTSELSPLYYHKLQWFI